jgi:HD superfamily phosphohydrolase
MKFENYKYARTDELEREVDFIFMNVFDSIEDEEIIPMEMPELLNKSIMILLDILKEHNIDTIQEVVDRFSGVNSTDNLIIHSMLADRIDYIEGEEN